jgi:hypothetical protein
LYIRKWWVPWRKTMQEGEAAGAPATSEGWTTVHLEQGETGV